jgi:propionyl-CoA synthetase
MARTDDVINTAGHRISTGPLEEALNEHEMVVESAVIGMIDDMTEKPFAYCILRNDSANMSQADKDKLAVELNNKVRKDCGAFCRLRGCLFMEKLPKTRSGKILRGTIRSIANGDAYKAPATIEDSTALDLLEKAMADWRKANPSKKEKVKFAKL